ncbi:GIN domain-containing protein [Photobacterium ganghwense]|uniref:GIN domain-containing protein n=1 Tax=Photobacterium ganghwense TaxID=320778 RepID=UPI0040575812
MKFRCISTLVILLTCSSWAFGNEDLVERKIPMCDYTSLMINVPSTVKVVARGVSSGSVKGVSEELDTLKYTCDNDKLEISTNTKIKIKEGFIFEFVNGSINTLTFNGKQNADITELDAKYFHLAINGFGQSLLSGHVEHFIVSLNGAAQVEASSLESQSGKINVNGSGLVKINVVSELDAKVNGSGRIEYLAKPNSLETHVNDSGSISLSQ